MSCLTLPGRGPLANPPTNALFLPSWYLVLSPSQPYFLRLGGHREGIKGIGKGLLASEGGGVEEKATAYAYTFSSQASRGFHSNPHKSKSSFYSCGSWCSERASDSMGNAQLKED